MTLEAAGPLEAGDWRWWRLLVVHANLTNLIWTQAGCVVAVVLVVVLCTPGTLQTCYGRHHRNFRKITSPVLFLLLLLLLEG